jgi:RsmE family RNA methyltransferase
VLGAAVGDRVLVGRVGGRLGQGTVVELGEDRAVLTFALDRDPPPKLPVTLALALPRPLTLRKVLSQATAIGVDRIVVFGAARVEKSYWQSSGLAPDAIAAQLRLGLEQARDTVPPEVELHRRFRPFVEEVLPRLGADRRILLADPEAGEPCPAGLGTPAVLVVGPEGGLVPVERELLVGAGAELVSFGARPLRVETAVVALLGRLGPGPAPAR